MSDSPKTSLAFRRKISRPLLDSNSLTHVRDGFVIKNLNDSILMTLAQWHSQFPPSAKVLDVGCGEQPYRKNIRSLGFDYFSADINQNRAQSVDFLFNLENPLPTEILTVGPFDMILATEVIEHIHQLEKCFKNLRQLLAPNGQLLITCPFVFPLHEEPYDFWRPTPHALASICHKTGFKIMKSERLGSAIECLGLTVGHIINEFPFETPSSFSQQIGISVRQRIQLCFLRSIHWLIKRGILNSASPKVKTFYLTNYLILSPDIS